MKIRRYKGPNREALYQAIRKEMGPNAVVVTPDTVPGALFGKPRHELIAIVEDGAPAGVSREDESLPVVAPEQPGPAPRAPLPADDFKRWRCMQARQWRELQDTIGEIRAAMADLKSAGGTPVPDPSPGAVPVHARGWDERLIALARCRYPDLLSAEPAAVERALADWLPIADGFSLQRDSGGPHVIALVGPTGSGKTTTLAKLAEIASVRRHLRVGLITTDTYRVAAVDQIREYASLMELPLRVAFSADEARKAMAALSDCDVILVDTPGRACGDKLGLATTHKVLGGLEAASVLLVVPATMAPGDLPDMFAGFSGFRPCGLIVTKVDEPRRPTIFTALPFETDLRVMFVTNGQRVPQDIFNAAGGPVARLILAGVGSVSERAAAEPVARRTAPAYLGAKASPVLDAADAAIQECRAILARTRRITSGGRNALAGQGAS